VQGILQAVDRSVPYGSGASIALATRDVYQYLKNDAVRSEIDDGVAQAFPADRESVVVSHSLGTVVAYHLLSTTGAARGWRVPQFITLGSPLGVTEIRKTVKALAGPLRCPSVAAAWFNAMDDRDVVALYPLTPERFPLSPTAPAVDNKTDVRNRTANRHGITGYLDDADVAARIYDALTA
jgi:pimeloyl-ACP methyl ester carboxylesterase